MRLASWLLGFGLLLNIILIVALVSLSRREIHRLDALRDLSTQTRDQLAGTARHIDELQSAVSTLPRQFPAGRDALLRAYTAEPIVLQPFDDNPSVLDQVTGGRGFRDTSGKVRTPCPNADPSTAVMLIAGQSNAGNHGDTKFTPGPGVYNLNLYDGACYLAADPLLGTTGTQGNFATQLGDNLVQSGTYRAVVLLPIAMAGSSVTDWAPTGIFHRRLLVALARAQAAKLRITHFLWQQGEADIVLGSGQEYIHTFEDIFISMRQHGMLAPIFVARGARCGFDSSEITSAQETLVNQARGIHPGPDTDSLGRKFRDAENCHMNAEGVRRQAAMWAQALADAR
jgi:hypothetical protein